MNLTHIKWLCTKPMINNYIYLKQSSHFSKFLFSFCLENRDTTSIKNCLTKIFQDYKPKFVHSDHGREFDNRIVRQYFKANGKIFIMGKVAHPKSQGVVERVHRTIKRKLNTYLLEIQGKTDIPEESKDLNYVIDKIRDKYIC